MDIAFDLFSEKIKFVCMLEPNLKPVDSWTQEGGKLQRRRRIVEHYSGRRVSVEDLEKLFVGVSGKTLKRDLHDLGAQHVGGGVWEVPRMAS